MWKIFQRIKDSSTNKQVDIFNIKRLEIAKSRAKFDHSINRFYSFCTTEILERLSFLNKNFQNILNINSSNIFLSKHLKNKYPDAEIIEINDTFEDSKKFDLIAFSCGLHIVGDVPSFFKRIRDMLSDDGIFIANFIGNKSFIKLKEKLIEFEIKANQIHYPHILPFIHFDHVVPLLQGAGFAEIIVDTEIIEYEYNNIISYIKSIKSSGEINILKPSNNYAISKKMFKFLSEEQEKFQDEINLINLLSSKNKNQFSVLR
jgi:NADH dehydrogenase [ubiquinone] 1 alpha subcomplex assembly factor 5